MKQAFTYDLAFVAPLRKPKTAPEIVFIIKERHLVETAGRLQNVVEQYSHYTDTYLDNSEIEFTLPVPDLFGHIQFGYRGCGYATVEDGKVYFRLPLRPLPSTHYCSLTIFLLTMALEFPFADEGDGRQQDVLLTILCERGRSAGYGHAVGGWLSEKVVRWLEEYAKDTIQRQGLGKTAPLHPEVIRAKQAVWQTINSPSMQGYASPKHINGWVHRDGAFSMNCFGNACDLSIYPDSCFGKERESVRFGCHNLDTAEQQLTLLAGLAKICQLARENP